MRVLLSWLREFAPIEGDPVELGEQMSDLGMAVESIEYPGRGLDGIVVARVLDLRPHPQADRIQLVDVDAGDGEALQICCGAFNMAVGDLVPLATLGTVMPDGMTIERRKLRGEWSNGMLCSGREIGLGDDHAGILILDPAARPGTDLRQALGLVEDVLYDLEINPNRPDAMSVAGVARDLAARLGVPFTQLDPPAPTGSGPAGVAASVEIVDPALCGRLYARLIDGVTPGTSPEWMANRLRSLGMRPINSVVDVSNYVMLELGLPTHTYDVAKLTGPVLRTRFARDGERIVTLDDVERTLSAADGVLTDADDVPVGISGVMGGASTEISETTTAVLLGAGLVGPDDHRPHLEATQPAQRGLGPLRAGDRPRRRSSWPRPASPSCWRRPARRWRPPRSRPGATCPTAHRCGCAPSGSTPSSAPSWRRGRSTGCSRPSASRWRPATPPTTGR